MKFGRYGVAAVALAALGLMAGAAAWKTVQDNAGSAAQAGPAQGGAPAVTVDTVRLHTFSDEVQALGTAQAFESVTIASKVPDRIRALHFDSGQRVSKGQVLVELASLEQDADLAEAVAQLEADQSELQRIVELSERGFATRAALDAAKAAAARSEARVEALRARIADRTLRAPFAGVLGLRNASVGQLVQPGDEIVTLDDVSRIKLDFEVPENQLTQVRRGVALVAETAAYPGRVFRGEVDQLDSRIDPATRTVRARAVLPNRDGALKPGMLMTVRVKANPHDSLAIPETALLERGEGVFVYRLADESERPPVELARVDIGLRQAGMVEVLTGLAQGDRLVVEGVNRVRPGQPIEPVPARGATMAAPGGGDPIERAN